MHETIFAIHIHTTYSDGSSTHQEIVKDAAKAGLDGIITTDHNILVRDMAGYYGEGRHPTMLIVGEEIHDRQQKLPGQHLLTIGAGKELSPLAKDPQRLIDQINRNQGLSFIAHPVEDALPLFNEASYPWHQWDIKDFTGIELWNHMSEFKSVTKHYLDALVNVLFPKQMTIGPLERTLKLWDTLIAEQKRPIVAIGGVDAHALIKKFGPFTFHVYPYLHHFKSVTTHILTEKPFTGEFEADQDSVLNALKKGHCFVAYDLPQKTTGFRFTAHNDDGDFIMGDQVSIKRGITLQIRLPRKTLCRLFKDGNVIKTWNDRPVMTHNTREPGIYRVEAYIPFKRKLRGWIFSNPIYAWPNP